MNINLTNFSSSMFPSSDCWVVQNSPRATRPDLGLKEGEAARLALQELENLKGTDAHRLALVPVIHSLHELQSLFHSLDKYLFRRVLKDHVSFRLSSEISASIHGITSALGSFDSQIVITLNSSLVRPSTQLALVASLIHQMSHAYLLVCCGFGDSNGEDERHDLRHGLAFSSIVHTIQDLMDDGRIPLPDLFYCNETISRSARQPRYRPFGRSLHSYCHFNHRDHEDKIACASYMRHVIAAAKAESWDPSSEDSSSTSASQSIGTLTGLMYSARLPNLYRAQGNLHPTWQLAPTSSAGTVRADIPTSGDYQALMNLQTFLAFGDYNPKIVSGLHGCNMEGPPRIHVDDKHTIKESSPTNPVHDLRTYILALRASMNHLRRLALARLYSQRLLKKEIDAMHFLEEIYTGAPSGDEGPGDTVKDYQPDEDLRRFSQAFLCAAHPDLPTNSPGVIELEYHHTILGTRITGEKDTEPATMDNTNLHILQSTEKYSSRLSRLRAQGGLFLEDLDIVQTALSSQEPIQPPDGLLGSAAQGRVLPQLDAANIGLANGVLESGVVLGRLQATEEQRRADARYQQCLRPGPLLGLGAAPVSIGDLVDEVRLEDLERLSGLRF